MFLFLPARTKHRIPKTRGFTLVEMMVSIGIIVLVTGLALVRYGAFNNTVVLKSQALELALDIRQAQTSSVSVSVESGTVASERDGYGVFVSTANSKKMSYGLFRDLDKPYYQHETDPHVGQDFMLDPRFEIHEIKDQNGTAYNNASITFRRPNFDAILYVESTPVTRVDIVLAVIDDPTITRTVSVYSSGQITVQ